MLEDQFFEMLSNCLYLWEAVSTCQEFKLRGLPITWKCREESDLWLTYKGDELHYSF